MKYILLTMLAMAGTIIGLILAILCVIYDGPWIIATGVWIFVAVCLWLRDSCVYPYS